MLQMKPLDQEQQDRPPSEGKHLLLSCCHQHLLREETRLKNNFRAQMGRRKGSLVGMTARVVRREYPHSMPADEDRGMLGMGGSPLLQLRECILPSRRRICSLLPSAQLEKRMSHHTARQCSLGHCRVGSYFTFWLDYFFIAKMSLCMFWLQIALAQLMSLMSK